MKYIHLIMLDYIKPLLKKHKESKENLKYKGDMEETNKTHVEIERKIDVSGMGDYDYAKIPAVATCDDERERVGFSEETLRLLAEMDEQLAADFLELEPLKKSLDRSEKEAEKRRQAWKNWTEFREEIARALENRSENDALIDEFLSHYEDIANSWQCLIDDFRKIPEKN
ncbi:unnamed protein product [Phyllotreta striolata]|uniref:Uncharacterized protein n=1 Tax=Phyllotreta striolata TaxID=444603 RepID=A0A9N9TXN7_PHYSR|nr:unnamed protein product [Phyllotreta striolata]